MLRHFGTKFVPLIVAVTLVFATQLSAQSAIAGKADRSPGVVPTSITDKQVYLPRELVTIGGANFLPFERVSIEVSVLEKATGNSFAIEYLDASASVDGSVSGEWKLWDLDGGGNRYLLKMSGLYSGRESSVGFSTKASLVPTPFVVAGNPDCGKLNGDDANFPHITSNWGFRLDDRTPNGAFPFVNGGIGFLTGGAPSDPGNSVTISVPAAGNEVTSWASTKPITAVILQLGNVAVVYPYDPASLGPDGPLSTLLPEPINNVEFCFQPTAKITIVKHASPPSNQQFDFTASPGLTPSAFSLVDNSINTDPMRMFFVTDFNVKTITETVTGQYTLQSINCTVDVGTGGTPTPVRTGNSIAIDIKSGDQVTCTFNNDFLTAANVSVSGRVFDRYGRGLARAMISVTDGDGNRKTVITNPFGYYRVGNLEAGGSHLFEVRHKSYNFASRLVSVNDNIANVNFTPQ